MPTLLLLGSGELGKEAAISAKRLGCRVVAVDRYPLAPAMQVADACETIDMLDGDEIERVVAKHAPDFVVPEIEAIRTERLIELEKRGVAIVPSARAAHLTMNRDAIRDTAAKDLKLPTAKYAYASSAEELRAAVVAKKGGIGLPCVVKPVMSSSGKGQSVVRKAGDLDKAWAYAVEGMRGDRAVVIVEEFIEFDYEITLLTIKQRKSVGPTLFVQPIGHRQERGDYQESWMPCPMKPALVAKAQAMAKKVVDWIAGPEGAGIFGVEFFVRGTEVLFSELSPRPHDTGMVTLWSQDLSEFDLHIRAILGLPIPEIRYHGPTASAVVLADRDSPAPPIFTGVEKALATPGVDVRLFGKPSMRPYRRMGVVLARGRDVAQARRTATAAAKAIRVVPSDR
jgi:phosphoribosylglycinamide formyltransferase 2